MLENLGNFISKNSHYILHDDWSELDKFGFCRGHFSLVSISLPESDSKGLNIFPLQTKQVEVTVLDENWA